MDKGRIFYNLQGKSTFKDTFTNLFPAWVRGFVGSSEKHQGGGKVNWIELNNEFQNCLNNNNNKMAYCFGSLRTKYGVDNVRIYDDDMQTKYKAENFIKKPYSKKPIERVKKLIKEIEKKYGLSDAKATPDAKAEVEAAKGEPAANAKHGIISSHGTWSNTNAKSPQRVVDRKNRLDKAKAEADAKAKAKAEEQNRFRIAEEEYNRNMKIGVASAFVILCLILRHRRNKSNRVVKLLETPSSFIKDSIEESGLSNNGYYNGALADTNSNLHHLFKVSDKKNETVDELRYRLFTKWKSSYWASNQLQSSHLIRSNGSIRDTVEEIGNAIQRLQDFNPLRIPSMSFSKVYTYLTRRKSSQKYLRSRSSRKNRSRKSKR